MNLKINIECIIITFQGLKHYRFICTNIILRWLNDSGNQITTDTKILHFKDKLDKFNPKVLVFIYIS